MIRVLDELDRRIAEYKRAASRAQVIDVAAAERERLDEYARPLLPALTRVAREAAMVAEVYDLPFLRDSLSALEGEADHDCREHTETSDEGTSYCRMCERLAALEGGGDE